MDRTPGAARSEDPDAARWAARSEDPDAARWAARSENPGAAPLRATRNAGSDYWLGIVQSLGTMWIQV